MPGTTKVNVPICQGITTVSVQPSVSLYGYEMLDSTYQATVIGTGAVSATVKVEVSLDGIGWLSDTTSTLSLSGTTSASAAFTSSAPWTYVRANITAISGTGAAVTVTVGG